MRKSKLIAVAFPLGAPHLEAVFHGIVSYARQRRLRWSFLTSPESWALSVHQLRGWNGDGAVVMVNTPDELRQIAKASFPVVSISDALITTGVPSVTVDNAAIGRMAADHLLACGFRRFAYYGLHQTRYAQERETAFISRLEEQGSGCAQHNARPRFGSSHADWMEEQEDLARWLKSLEKPLGLLAASGARADRPGVCHLCHLRVPHDVGILGVNNDVTICEHCDPPLSTVSCNSEQVGQQAAAMLDRLLRGRRLETREIWSPTGSSSGVRRTHAVFRMSPWPLPSGSFRLVFTRISASPRSCGTRASRGATWNANSGKSWACLPTNISAGHGWSAPSSSFAAAPVRACAMSPRAAASAAPSRCTPCFYD